MPEDALKRKLGLFPATNIVVANMIGAGIFTTSGLLMAQLNNPVLMLGLWIVGGIIALCGAISYGELGANIPQAGGEYQFLKELYHPMLGFLSGWVSFIVGFSAPIAASAMGFSEYLLRAFPASVLLNESTGILDPGIIKNLISIAVILIFTVIHYRGIEFGSRVQDLLTVLKILLIVVLLAAGIITQQGDPGNFTGGERFSGGFDGWKTIGLSLMWIMFAYSGWNASTYIGSEIKSPERNLPGSLLIGTTIVLLLYIGINAIYIYSIPGDEIKGVIAIGGLAMKNLFGSPAETLFSLLIAFALFSSLSAFIIIGPRVYYSMAKDGLFFKSIARIHPTFKVPSNAIVLQSVIAIIMVLSGTFEQILTYMGFALGIFPVLTVFAVFKLRQRKSSAIKLRGFPVPQIIYMTAGILILTLAFLERPVASSVALLTVVTGIPAYFLFRREK
ncbi:MAG: amino acid permease [Bacteroidales bacterium]